jgi:hypothetical protein
MGALHLDHAADRGAVHELHPTAEEDPGGP